MKKISLPELKKNPTRKNFIAYFEAIPDEEWCTRSLDAPCGKKCALGHLGIKNYTNGVNEPIHVKALAEILKKFAPNEKDSECVVYRVNDECRSLGKTPKERILTALK